MQILRHRGGRVFDRPAGGFFAAHFEKDASARRRIERPAGVHVSAVAARRARAEQAPIRSDQNRVVDRRPLFHGLFYARRPNGYPGAHRAAPSVHMVISRRCARVRRIPERGGARPGGAQAPRDGTALRRQPVDQPPCAGARPKPPGAGGLRQFHPGGAGAGEGAEADAARGMPGVGGPGDAGGAGPPGAWPGRTAPRHLREPVKVNCRRPSGAHVAGRRREKNAILVRHYDRPSSPPGSSFRRFACAC